MLTGTVWGLALIAVGVVATLAASQLLLATLFPRRLAAARRALRTRPWSCGGAGLVVALVTLLPLKPLGTAAPVLGGALGFAGALVALFGLAAVASELGARLPSTGRADTAWRALLRGSVTLSLASLLPLVGWLAVFPAAVACGLGSWALAPLFREDAQPAAAAAPAPAAAEAAA